MKKKYLLTILLPLFIFFIMPKVNAYDLNNYIDRAVCPNQELVIFNVDGTLESKGCFSTYEEAKVAMDKETNPNAGILWRYANQTKILDAKNALVDTTSISGGNTYLLYPSINAKTEYTYSIGGTGGNDAALLDSGYSTSLNSFVIKLKIAGYEGWTKISTLEIVPLVWVKSSSTYTISNETIRHNYVSKIQEPYYGSSGNTIGPKPDGIQTGTFYSYDGHYFYTDRYKMLADYKAGNYNNSVNKDNPYYNYYQYLSNHTRTTYSSIVIDEYIRNVLGYKKDVYGISAIGNASKLYGMGTFFYNAQELYGANALLALGHSRNESGNGQSRISIRNNNGFGLGAVDSNPSQSAKWYPTFSSSILGYANKWVTNGYLKTTDGRYKGAQYGNKSAGMSVDYASDPYWGEKMTSNAYFFDKAYGLQDYNFYQLGVTTTSLEAKSGPSFSTKTVYNYKKDDYGVVIVGEVEGQEVNGNKTWYKIMSDQNIDSNFNALGLNNKYNWENYVYVPAAYIKKINKGKNGYISPSEVTAYSDSKYTYDLHVEEATHKPKVGISIKETSYYYDPTRTSPTGQKLANNRYVMVFATAYDEKMNPVAYLVTSDYEYSQSHWVPTDAIRLTTSKYGQAFISLDVNACTLVNKGTYEDSTSQIGCLWTYAYTPILEEKTVNNVLWYRVPVDLSGDRQEFGWTMSQDTNVAINVYQYTASNTAPVITATDKSLLQGKTFDPKKDVTAYDLEDKDLTSKITVISNNVNNKVPGTYQVTYRVEDSGKLSATKTITVTIIKDEEPVITAHDIVIQLGDTKPNLLLNVTATDKEDGKLTAITVDDSKVNYNKVGEYQLTYSVTDSYNHKVTKTVKLIVKEKTAIAKVLKQGRFDLDYLKEENGLLAIKGYSTIDSIANDLQTPITYKIVFENIADPKKTYEQALTRITDKKDIAYETPSVDGKVYTYSWFKGTIDITKLPAGDYLMYIIAETSAYYSKNVVNNQMFSEQLTSMTKSNKYLMTRNNYFAKDKPIEILIRDEKLGTKTTSALSNQFGQIEDIKFTNTNKLYIYGNAFSTGMNLSTSATVTRKIIFEDMETFKKYSYDLGSTTKSTYVVKLPVDDKLGKEKAWYEKELDISALPKGKYSIYIETTANLSDIGELNEQLFRDLTTVTRTINNKKYTFDVNYNQRYRVELTVS